MTCPYLRYRGRDLCKWLDDWYPYRDPACCPDTCPCGTGPWGAWRAALGHFMDLNRDEFVKSKHHISKMRIVSTVHPGISEPLDAVGWSP